jgi:hypothetical protein
MLAGCTYSNPGFLASYWSAEFGTFLQVSALSSFFWAGGLCIIFPIPGKYKIRFQLPTSDRTLKNFLNIYLIITKTSKDNNQD